MTDTLVREALTDVANVVAAYESDVATSLFKDALTLADRCEACGAAAVSQVIIAGDVMLFCGHHHRKNREAFIRAGYPYRLNDGVDDFTYTFGTKPVAQIRDAGSAVL